MRVSGSSLDQAACGDRGCVLGDVTFTRRKPESSSLHLNALKSRLYGFYSMSIAVNFRITIGMIISEKGIILVSIDANGDIGS